MGFGRHGEGRGGFPGAGPTVVITDLGLLRPDPETSELVLVAVHPGVDADQVRAQTGWPLVVAHDLVVSEPPTLQELEILRDLKERTRQAHAG
jgi:acyl CoA:acetate/3-ketoacid CoA transferase beta subunit